MAHCLVSSFGELPSSMADKMPGFFSCNGFDAGAFQACMAFIESRFPDHGIQMVETQGGCSFTAIAVQESDCKSTIVQLRLSRFSLQRQIARDARNVYGTLAPQILHLQDLDVGRVPLQYVEMTQLPGTRLSELLPQRRWLEASEVLKLQKLLQGMARFFAQGWRAAVSDPTPRACDGRIGSSILARLQLLERDLPSPPLRQKARALRAAVAQGALGVLPKVLHHGDLLPSNLLVDPRTWEVTGVVDWAEGEFLPFGLTLYGVEHLLGSLGRGTGRERFEYFRPQVRELREGFWRELVVQVPEIVALREVVQIARDVGVLLWHGFAWDGGRLDRVVEEGGDGEEVAYLTAFLDVKEDGLRSTL